LTSKGPTWSGQTCVVPGCVVPDSCGPASGVRTCASWTSPSASSMGMLPTKRCDGALDLVPELARCTKPSMVALPTCTPVQSSVLGPPGGRAYRSLYRCTDEQSRWVLVVV